MLTDNIGIATDRREDPSPIVQINDHHTVGRLQQIIQNERREGNSDSLDRLHNRSQFRCLFLRKAELDSTEHHAADDAMATADLGHADVGLVRFEHDGEFFFVRETAAVRALAR